MPTLVQIMAWCWPGDKSLSEPMMESSMTHICVTRPEWVEICKISLSVFLSLLKTVVQFIWNLFLSIQFHNKSELLQAMAENTTYHYLNSQSSRSLTPYGVTRGPFHWHGLILVPAWTSYHMLHCWFGECTSTFTPHFIMDVITYPRWDLSYSMLVKGPRAAINWSCGRKWLSKSFIKMKKKNTGNQTTTDLSLLTQYFSPFALENID